MSKNHPACIWPGCESDPVCLLGIPAVTLASDRTADERAWNG